MRSVLVAWGELRVQHAVPPHPKKRQWTGMRWGARSGQYAPVHQTSPAAATTAALPMGSSPEKRVYRPDLGVVRPVRNGQGGGTDPEFVQVLLLETGVSSPL